MECIRMKWRSGLHIGPGAARLGPGHRCGGGRQHAPGEYKLSGRPFRRCPTVILPFRASPGICAGVRTASSRETGTSTGSCAWSGP